jgi:hypothetical protein
VQNTGIQCSIVMYFIIPLLPFLSLLSLKLCSRLYLHRGTTVAVKFLFANCGKRKRKGRKWSDLGFARSASETEDEQSQLSFPAVGSGGDGDGDDDGGGGTGGTDSSSTGYSGNSSSDAGMAFSVKVAQGMFSLSELPSPKAKNFNGRLLPTFVPDSKAYLRGSLFRKEIRFSLDI